MWWAYTRGAYIRRFKLYKLQIIHQLTQQYNHCQEVMFSPVFACQHDNFKKNIKRINTKICGTNEHCPRTNCILVKNFG